MAVLTAASADVGYSPFRKLYSDRGLYLGYFLLTAMSKMRQNPFIICGSTGQDNPFIICGNTAQAGNYCGNIKYGGDCYISLSFQFAHGNCFGVYGFPDWQYLL